MQFVLYISNDLSTSPRSEMADLVPDMHELMRSVHLEDKQLFFLQCAMEENCLSSTAYEKQVRGELPLFHSF